MPATARPAAVWNLRSEHSGAFLRLQRMLEGRRSFSLCFLTYSDSSYRDKVADFLEAKLRAGVRVTIDPDATIGTEALFEKLSADGDNGPAQLIGLERWPEGLDDLLTRLNYRRGALAERCARPLLIWVPSQHLRRLATGAADLWAWRSGVFDFTLPADTDAGIRLLSPFVRETATAHRRRARVEELQRHLAGRTQWRPLDIDLALELGDLKQSLGEMEEAEASYRNARSALASLDDRRLVAITEGRIANILEARGELDEALRIRTEEELPVYERLGDVRARAVTQGQIAGLLEARGEFDEALRIRTEEQLPIFERIGDKHSRAVTYGQIADILAVRGEFDEALRIRTEEELPVYEQLGDARSIAVTRGRIADILQARGELDEALRIRTEEELPVYERLGDVRAGAIAQGRIADILQARGELDKALRIRIEEELPVYERLGDVRACAIAQARIADILAARGRLDEALRIYEEDVLPALRNIKNEKEIDWARGRIESLRSSRARSAGRGLGRG